MTQNDEEAKKQLFLVKIILVVIIAVLFIKIFDFRLDFDLNDFFGDQLLENNCWQRFKEEKCSVEKPISELCKRLLECSSKENKGDSFWNFDNFMALVLLIAILILIFSFRYWQKLERIGRKMRRKF